MKPLRILLPLIFLPFLFAGGCGNGKRVETEPTLAGLPSRYFQEDSSWYVDNVPLFECSDKSMEEVYYYRWKLFKAHIRQVDSGLYNITEFINHVPWDREPFCSINAASMHHIYEGRWLRDPVYLDGYIYYLCQLGGNDRRYTESIADAVYARYLVNSDTALVMLQLDSLAASWLRWQDHYDSSKHLYYTAAMPDATEYTIASVDGSGGRDGFDGGEAFRPSINSYMYGNAEAIAKLYRMRGDASRGDSEASKHWFASAANLAAKVTAELWNDSFQHFVDRHQVSNRYVKYWDFIRGRELVGFAPWYFNLPPDEAGYGNAWRHLLDSSQLLGPFGFRTNEPSYEHYFKQFVFFEGNPGSQWNGPSWPFQTSLMLTGMANLLNNYRNHPVTENDYVKLLGLYTRQHYLPDGSINLVENYNPDKGGPIVHFYWSNHYLHSTYNNLIISGLCGILPSASDTLTIHPLVGDSIQWFFLKNLRYHGRDVSVMYDADGSHYGVGKGISVWVDGVRRTATESNGIWKTVTGTRREDFRTAQFSNYALNTRRSGYPKPSASVNSIPDSSVYQAIDGKSWFFSEITNRWTSTGSRSADDWFAVDFGSSRFVSQMQFSLFTDGKRFALPESITAEYRSEEGWIPVTVQSATPLSGNTMNFLLFKSVNTTAIRLRFHHPRGEVALVELACY